MNSKEIKEEDMKLTKDDIGKEFENRVGSVFTLVLCSSYNCVLSTSDGGFYICRHDGWIDSVCSDTIDNRLVKRHEPRWWLNQLPDADILDGNWLAIDKSNRIAIFKHEPHINTGDCPFRVWTVEGDNYVNLYGIKNLPKLMDEEWKLSLISIDELRRWQQENYNV